ncbi:MAG TPA: hypothetical protein DD444_01540 [Citreicella sp.]|jgi:hypothetical protein|nr:hypothetical protein [Citreicella sp.]|tara:strand:+ start:449 stop:634 length:186 start_codon:yes stop_codon:yes gene_type:complete
MACVGRKLWRSERGVLRHLSDVLRVAAALGCSAYVAMSLPHIGERRGGRVVSSAPSVRARA